MDLTPMGPGTQPSAVALMRHQEEGIAFLLQRGSGLLAFEQGLGKTLVAIEAFRRSVAAGTAARLLVICPNHLKRNWVAELRKFAPELEVSIIEGDGRQRRQAITHARAAVVISSYETARAEIVGFMALLRRSPTILVLDECHAVKNITSLTSTAAQHFAPLAVGRWLLSGTPITNSQADLFAQINIVAAGRPLGSFDAFKVDYGAANLSAAVQEDLRARLAPYMMRRTKEACLDLPPKTFTDILVELPPWQRALYDEMRDNLVCEVRSMKGEQFRAFAPTALARLLRLSQLASNPDLIVPAAGRTPGKFLELDLLMDELVRTSGRKVIIWSYYVRTLEELARRYADVGVVTLYGGTPESERQDIAAKFQTDPSTRLLIGNPAAAGSGFTLTAASYTIYETLSWRYDFFAQSQDRNHRIGQESPVTYVRLIAVDTIEEVIAEALERKAGLARSLLGDTAALPVISEMSPEAFCRMLATNRISSVLSDTCSALSRDHAGLEAPPQ